MASRRSPSLPAYRLRAADRVAHRAVVVDELGPPGPEKSHRGAARRPPTAAAASRRAGGPGRRGWSRRRRRGPPRSRRRRSRPATPRPGRPAWQAIEVDLDPAEVDRRGGAARRHRDVAQGGVAPADVDRADRDRGAVALGQPGHGARPHVPRADPRVGDDRGHRQDRHHRGRDRGAAEGAAPPPARHTDSGDSARALHIHDRRGWGPRRPAPGRSVRYGLVQVTATRWPLSPGSGRPATK
jgi:hypothetical protein